MQAEIPFSAVFGANVQFAGNTDRSDTRKFNFPPGTSFRNRRYRSVATPRFATRLEMTCDKTMNSLSGPYLNGIASHILDAPPGDSAFIEQLPFQRFRQPFRRNRKYPIADGLGGGIGALPRRRGSGVESPRSTGGTGPRGAMCATTPGGRLFQLSGKIPGGPLTVESSRVRGGCPERGGHQRANQPVRLRRSIGQVSMTAFQTPSSPCGSLRSIARW